MSYSISSTTDSSSPIPLHIEIDVDSPSTAAPLPDSPLNIQNTLFHTPLTELTDQGPNGTVGDYLNLWRKAFKSNKDFIDHVIQPIMHEQNLRVHDYLEHSKAVQMGDQLAQYLINTFVTSHKQKSREVFNEFTRIHQEDIKLPCIKKAFQAIHDHRDAAYCELKNPEHPLKELDVKALHTYQLLAHRFAYNIDENVKEIEISIPINGIATMVTYKVQRLSVFLNFSAYGLTSTSHPEAPPILLFPGTSAHLLKKGASVGVVADFDPCGPGYTFFKLNTTIEEWLRVNTSSERNIKAVTMGHSLGGAFATHTTAFYNQYISEGYTFNSPGVGYQTANQYAKLEDKGIAPRILNVNTFEDLIPNLGHTRIGTDLVIIPEYSGLAPEEVAKNLIDSHKYTSLEFSSLIFEHQHKMILPSLVQTIVLPIFFAIGLAYLFLRTLVFGHIQAQPLTYLLSPLDLLCQLIYSQLQSLYDSLFIAQPILEAT